MPIEQDFVRLELIGQEPIGLEPIEQVPIGQELTLQEPIEQVPDSLKMDGYGIEAIEDRTEYFALQVRRPADL